MMFQPGSCERCATIWLLAGVDCTEGKALCGACGGLVVVVAGVAYPETDVYLFDAVRAAVKKSSLSAFESAQLALSLANLGTSRGEGDALEMAISRFPGLAALRSLLACNVPRARQALAMLDVVLWERSKSRPFAASPTSPNA